MLQDNATKVSVGVSICKLVYELETELEMRRLCDNKELSQLQTLLTNMSKNLMMQKGREVVLNDNLEFFYRQG